jgi:hypothetical protein
MGYPMFAVLSSKNYEAKSIMRSPWEKHEERIYLSVDVKQIILSIVRQEWSECRLFFPREKSL